MIPISGNLHNEYVFQTDEIAGKPCRTPLQKAVALLKLIDVGSGRYALAPADQLCSRPSTHHKEHENVPFWSSVAMILGKHLTTSPRHCI